MDRIPATESRSYLFHQKSSLFNQTSFFPCVQIDPTYDAFLTLCVLLPSPLSIFIYPKRAAGLRVSDQSLSTRVYFHKYSEFLSIADTACRKVHSGGYVFVSPRYFRNLRALRKLGERAYARQYGRITGDKKSRERDLGGAPRIGGNFPLTQMSDKGF